MNLKHTLLQNLPVTPNLEEMIGKIDLLHLNEFVTNLFSVFVENRGIDMVRYDLNDDVQTPTDAYLSDLFEIGAVQLLRENGLLHHEQYIDALYVILSAMNTVVARLMQQMQITEVAGYRYYDADLQYVLLERAVSHADQTRHDGSYLFDLVSFRLIGKANGRVVY